MISPLPQDCRDTSHVKLLELRDKHDVLWRKYWRQSLRQRALQQVILEQRERLKNSQGPCQSPPAQCPKAGDLPKDTGNGGDQKECASLKNHCKIQKTYSCPTDLFTERANQDHFLLDESTLRAPSPNTLSGEIEDNFQKESEGLFPNPFPEEAQVPHCVVEIASKYWGDEGLLRPKSAAPSDRRLSLRDSPADDFRGSNTGFQNM